MTTLIPDWLQRRARSHATQPALVFEGETLSFAELAERVAGFDQLLREHGAVPGDTIATLMTNSPALVAMAHAIPRDGRIFAPLGARLRPAEVAAMVDRCAARILVYEEQTKEIVAGLQDRRGMVGICVDGEPLPGDRRCDSNRRQSDPTDCDERIDLDRTHSVVFTSGTSGTPKGVRLTWGNHLWSALGSALNLGLSHADRWLCCLPLNHVGGLSILLRSALYGNAVELHRRFSPAAVNAAIRDRNVSIVSVVANMLQRMLDADSDRPYPPSLRAILVGGGPVPEALIARCRRAGVPVLPTYGLSETASQVATASPAEGLFGPGVGRPLPFVELRIADREGHSAPVGSDGEIQVRGPMVSPGYLDEADRGRDEWLPTRDRGSIDEQGCLHVLGRADDTVVCGGENVHPREIERVLEGHPAVAEAFAAGVPDASWGQVLHAAVRLRGAVDEAQLIAHCREYLASYKVPRTIVVVDDFPRTPAGKVARAEAAGLVSANPKEGEPTNRHG